MVKTSPSGGFTTSINAISQSFTFLIRMQRVDNTIFGFTNLDTDVTFNDGSGAVIYRHLPGIDRTSITTSSDVAVDNTEIKAFFDLPLEARRRIAVEYPTIAKHEFGVERGVSCYRAVYEKVARMGAGESP